MNKMIWKSLMCLALCAFALTAVSCGDDDDNNNTPGGVTPSPQTASVVGYWMVTDLGAEPHIIFFKADGIGGFLEYSTSRGDYHQDGAFRWAQNADGSYSFSGAGLHDGVYAAGIESIDGDKMRVWMQWDKNKDKEYATVRRMTSNEVAKIVIREQGGNVTPDINIVGNWDVVREIRSYYRNGAWESEDKSKSGPYDYIFFNADGNGGYMEYGSSGVHHQDGEFRWVRNADGSYTFSGEGLHDGVYSMAIKNTDGSNRMEVEVYWSTTKKSYFTLQRQVL